MEAATLMPMARHRRAGATDDELVARTRAGDDRAFEMLYHRYHRRITSYVLGMVRDHQRAEDVTQEVFLSALRRMRTTDRQLAFKPWIYEIAKNACIDQFRRGRRADEVSWDADEAAIAPLVSAGPAVDAAVHAKQQLDDLCGAFGGLSEAHHRILVLRELEGRSYAEIGQRLELTRPAVESTLFRARKRLGEEYEELVSGERCRRVRTIIETAGETSLGLRDGRKMARHVAHCQPCRHAALVAGLSEHVPTRTGIGAKIAAFLPLPAFARMRWLGSSSGPAATTGANAGDAANAGVGTTLLSWLHVAAPMADAGGSGWAKAVAAVATVAVAGTGVSAVTSSGGGSGHSGARGAVIGAVGPGAGAASGGSGSSRASIGLTGPVAAGAAGSAARNPAAHPLQAAGQSGAAGLGAGSPNAVPDSANALPGLDPAPTQGAAAPSSSSSSSSSSATGPSGSGLSASATDPGGSATPSTSSSSGATPQGPAGVTVPGSSATSTLPPAPSAATGTAPAAANGAAGAATSNASTTVTNVTKTVADTAGTAGTASAAAGETVTDVTKGSTVAPTTPVGDTAPTVPVPSNATQAVHDVVTTVTTTTGTLAQGLSSTVTGLGNGPHGGTG
jgi:RNA polymerase sigma factor (sigma-70 family)